MRAASACNMCQLRGRAGIHMEDAELPEESGKVPVVPLGDDEPSVRDLSNGYTSECEAISCPRKRTDCARVCATADRFKGVGNCCRHTLHDLKGQLADISKAPALMRLMPSWPTKTAPVGTSS